MKKYTLLKILLLCIIVFFSNCKNAIKETSVTLEIQNTDSIEKYVEASKEAYMISQNLQLKDYIYLQGYKPEDGFVPTAEIAVKVAEIILNKIYGEKNIEQQKPFLVNLENEIWLIEGQLENNLKGGVVYIEIKKSSGEILKVIHGK